MEDGPLAATALPSLATSACLFAFLCKFTSLGDLPLLHLVCFAALPTVSALACLQDQRFLGTFKRLFLWYVLRTEDPKNAEISCSDALVTVRSDLLKSIGERWPAPRGRRGPFSLSRFSSDSLIDASAASGVGSGSNNAGKSLYDQVRSHLTDHEFPKLQDAPIYFMDPTSGSFLRVNEQHKLVFTDTPDASCLFHVVKGKTHHWGFHSAIHQRYIGMNVLNKIVVNAKKMQSWESFRILERPEKGAGAEADTTNQSGTDRTIYIVLCSARFGKGMWLGRRRRTAANPTDLYLTKNFAHALSLVYASDLSAFEYISQPRTSLVGELTQSMSDSASDLQLSSSSLITSTTEDDPFGSDFQAPILQTAERSKVVLPWIDERASRRFLELPERQMVEVASTTISKCTVRDFLEFFIDQDARRMCHEKTNQAPAPPPNSSSGGSRAAGSTNQDDQRLSEWHLHPQFGFVRKLSYRPPSPASAWEDPSSQSQQPMPAASMAASIAIDQYHSCSVNEKSMQKAVFRSKIFTLSIPKSNSFSVETVFEFQDTQERDGIYALTPVNPMVVFKCRTGVHFTRKTMFAAQIEKGVLEGVKNTCDILLKLTDEFRASHAEGRLSSTSDTSTPARSRRDAFPPHILAVEVIKGLISAIRGNDRVGTSITRRLRSSLNVQMPWTPAPLVIASGRPSKQAATSGSVAHQPKVGGFFECAPQAFSSVLEESIVSSVSPSLVFDVVLSDASSFFHASSKQAGNMEVDIGAWRTARFPVDGGSNNPSFLRKQLFRMPVSGVAGLDVAQIEDYQYYGLQRATEATPRKGERLEYGMKIFARDLPDGERFSIEVVVIVEQASMPADASEAPPCTLRVAYAIAKTSGGDDMDDDPLQSALVHGTVRGLKRVWTRVANVIQDAVQRVSRSSNTVAAEDVRHRLHIEGKLPHHDELTSTIIEAITELY